MILLFDTPKSRANLYPLSLTRPVCEIRHGILTIREFWQQKTGTQPFFLTETYLQQPLETADIYISADASVIPDDACFEKIIGLQPGEMLEDDQGIIAFASQKRPVYNQLPVWLDHSITVARQRRISHASQLFLLNAQKIRSDFELLTRGRQSISITDNNTVISPQNVFVEEGAEVNACIINASEGPVFIAANALVMEGTMIRGPVAICNNAVVKMGTRIYGGTTVGPFCTAGGEIKNALMMGYCNKAHDGYLGDSVLGEWCNLGAGTSNSNVKNTAGEVKMWSEADNKMIPVGNKAGMIMGDYSRTAINASINTGTTIGVSCNIYEGTYPAKNMASFSWGNYETYDFEKACRDAQNWKKMKGRELTEADRLILQHIFKTRIADKTEAGA